MHQSIACAARPVLLGLLLSAQLWKQLEAKAKAEGISLHSALRAAILDWAKRTP